MLITKTSPLNGVQNTLEVNITKKQYQRICDRFHSKELIQDIVPDLDKDLREFLISGYTPKDWKKMFGEL